MIADPTLEAYQSLKPFLYQTLVRLEVVQDFADDTKHPILSIKLLLSAKASSETRQLVLSFSGVRDLKLEPFVQPLHFSSLQVISVREKRWEGVNYRVYNAEQDTTFAFTCSAFSAAFE